MFDLLTPSRHGVKMSVVATVRDELIGVPRAVAARVVGVPEHRLRRWNQIGLVEPSVSSRLGGHPVWTFSLEDLVQASVVRQLEDRGADVRTIRRIVEAVRSATDPKPLASLRWAIDSSDVFVGFPDGSWVRGRRPKETVIQEVLELDEIRARAREAIQRPRSDAGAVEKRRRVVGNKEIFAGTRIPVEAVVDYLRAGASSKMITEAFPDLTDQDIALARQRLTRAS